ncbi:MAG: endonuclease/exonuclease/phosphatase family protein, partial [Flavobacteriaceae bacterium]
MSTRAPYLLTLFFCGSLLFSQHEFEVATIAFYNVENAFDAIDDPDTMDDDRTPTGKDKWTDDVYKKKLHNNASIIAAIGRHISASYPAVIGLCEVENQKVIDDLIRQPSLSSVQYGVIHYDSPDERGIDVALLYKKGVFIPQNFRTHVLFLYDKKGERDKTRDQLVVGGFLGGERLYFIVNHWPSRSGGQARSQPYRLKAAKLNLRIIDSIQRLDPNAKIISMGDFNDDPTNKSFKTILQTTGKKQIALKENRLYNPMEVMHKNGLGTSAYRNRWHVLDQMYMTPSLLEASPNRWRYWKAEIFNPPQLIHAKGPYKGTPFR